MKKSLSTIIIISMLAVLSGCTPKDEPLNAEIAGSTIPLQEVESADIIAESVFNIDAPKGASDISYYTINYTIAQIEYALNDRNYVLRASSLIHGEELHGNTSPVVESLLTSYTDNDIVDISAEIYLLEDGSTAAIAEITRFDAYKYNITLLTKDEITLDEMSDEIIAVGKTIY